ncbi:uncharacterized protein LOC119356248 isoform X2 [Triticum dicoccoides]|uniref:Uncharacterized protein n=2 Tax=Triticum TaxID=4564 RepID=A0A9R1P3E0_TRITD|nr:uncharacterized protein LOC119356248 isoform X2 [Triticum dicoccoides]VAH35844.1 unnamed protein product [Triticum turgidum subsp. durum]
MAPPRQDSPEGLEVQCAGCGETLEVDPGLTEFICPDCATPQSLPPELMPPPPPRRKALPLPRAAADVRGARLPCGSCGALLSVPVGLARCACPVCGAELAVDTARLRHYLLSSATAEGAVPVVPLGDPSAPPILQAQQVQTNQPNQLIPEQADLDNPGSTIERGEVHDVSGEVHDVNGIFAKRTSMYSVGPGIVSPERRHEEPQNHDRHQAQVQSSTTRINCRTGRSTAPQTVNIEKRQLLTPDQTIQQAEKQPSCRAICTEKAHAEDADGVIHVQEKQQQRVSQVNHTEELCTQAANEIITRDNNGTRVGYAACSDAAFAERRKVHEANDAIKQVQRKQSDSTVHMEPENEVIHVEKEHSKSFSCRTPKQKKKGLTAASNPGLQLRRSKRLVKDSPASIDQEPVQNVFLESQEGTSISHIPATVRVSEPTESDSDSLHAGSPEQSEPTENDPDWQHAGSPEQSLSDSPDIDRIINNIKPSPPPPCEMHEPSSNKLDSPHLTTPTSNSDLNLSDPEQFARNYIPLEVRKALPALRSNSLFEHTMSQASYGEASLHDLTDSEGDDPCSPTLQNVGTKRNHKRLRCGLKLSLEVWTLPKGVRIPVSLNTSGEPVGKAAGTLSNFLCAIARDGVLAPLTYHDWRRVPEKNKNIIWHIVKLKFDIAPVGELWIMKSLGKRWRSWKSFLKLQHYDTHETEEERLADRNPRVLKEQWQFLVAYWSTEKAKAASARSKACQSNVVAHHTAGTKSFARIIEEEKQKRPNKDGPSVEDLFIMTHTPKNGKPMKKATADAIARLRKQVESSGGDSAAHDSSKVPRGKAVLQASFKEAMEAKRRAEDEASALKEKMMAMEESQRKMQEDLANMKSAVSAIHKTAPTGDLQGQQMHKKTPVSKNSQDEPTGGPSFPPGFAKNPNPSQPTRRSKRAKRS